jgi:hypothetical protein
MSSRRTLPRLLPLAIAFVGLVVATTPVQAQVIDIYRASMSGAEVVPPTPAGDCSVEGMFLFDGQSWWCTDSPDHLLTFSSFYSGLSGPPTGCHMHRGAAGVNGERLYTIHDGFFPPNYPLATVAINPADCADLDAQNIYIVITTDRYPDGEVRGQVFPDYSGPVEPSTWGSIKSVYR